MKEEHTIELKHKSKTVKMTGKEFDKAIEELTKKEKKEMQ